MKRVSEKLPELDKAHIRKTALEILRARGFRAWPQNNVRAVKGRSFVGQKGVSDIIGWQNATGLTCFTEVKTINDKLSDHQIELLSALHQSGGIALVATQSGTGVILIPFIDYLNKLRSKV